MSLLRKTDKILLLLTWFLLFSKVYSSGVAILQLIKYENPSGKGANGNCCDSYWGYCTGRSSYCDYYFVICLDKPDGTRSVRSCAIGSKRTRTLSNMNVVVFGRSIGGTPNPMRFPFSRWYTDGIRIKIDVYDDDSTGSDDFVQYYNKLFLIRPGNPVTITFAGRTRLTASLEVVCDSNWYGNDCNTYCVPQQDDFLGHYNCDEMGQRICLPGWTGYNCMNNIDECESSPCGNRGRCQDALNSYYCNCYYGYAGTNCDVITDYCVTQPCQNNGWCTKVGAGYTCTCLERFTGENCEVKINYCESFPCQNNATCQQRDTGFTCLCSLGFSGDRCEIDIDECSVHPCQHGGTCQDLVYGYRCTCVEGFTGDDCEVDINECDSDPCMNGALCLDRVGSYTCQCSPGYSGIRCEEDIDECVSSPCLNDARCVDLANKYTCTCAEGFTGSNCQTDIDDCVEGACSGNGDCTDGIAQYYCSCHEGWTGDRCEVKVPYCNSSPCLNNGTCIEEPLGYGCSCQAAYTGSTCDVLYDPCYSDPCLYNGTCVPDDGQYRCTCEAGRTGSHCEEDVDECEGFSPCANNATCVNIEPGYRCLCTEGWTDVNCTAEIDPCLSLPCNNGGRCIRDYPGYTCQCTSGYSGERCAIEVTLCNDSTCDNGGTCQQADGRYTCICPPGFTGLKCQNVVDTAKSAGAGLRSLHFTGRMGIYESKVFVKMLQDLAADRLNVSRNTLRIVHEMDYCQDENGDDVTIINFQLRSNTGAMIPRSVYDDISHELSTPDSKGILPLPLHHGDCYHMPKVAESTEKQGSWIEKTWPLVAAIGSVLLIVVAVMVVAMKLSRRRPRRDSYLISLNPAYEPRPSVISTQTSYSYVSERNSGSRSSYMGTERFHELELTPPNLERHRK